MPSHAWFAVDKKGLADILARRGKAFAVFELIQNAWDESNDLVRVTLEKIPGGPFARLTVEDDSPQGFSDLAHAFTLFAPSTKKSDPTKRGRFNLGEKLVLALCKKAKITSTTGSIAFTEKGRVHSHERRRHGTLFEGVLPITRTEYQKCCAQIASLLPPNWPPTYFNGKLLPQRKPLAVLEASLPTEVADEEGRLRRTQRTTTVCVYECLDGETASLYEMGLPVVETGDRWHVEIRQKIPLNLDRDNVSPSYLRAVRTIVANGMRDGLSVGDAAEGWVREALSDPRCELETVRRVVDLRFGPKAVTFDPSDIEANHLAASRGYTVVPGGNLCAEEWANVRRAGALPPAGQVTPSLKPWSDDPNAPPLRLLDETSWSPGMHRVVDYARSLARIATGSVPEVQIGNDSGWPFLAVYGPGRLILNAGRLGRRWFDEPDMAEVTTLLIHEFGHHFAQNHLSSDYHDALCRIGGELVAAALNTPNLFSGIRQEEDRIVTQ
ncbi:MAG: ATP-binding protein [Acidiferrobacterales bacterium]